MKKMLAIVVIGVAGVLVAGNWLFGQQAQVIQENILQSALFDGHIDSGRQAFDRGVFSTAVNGQVSAGNGNVDVSWRQTTHHGPFPWARLGKPSMTAQVVLAKELQFSVNTLFGIVQTTEPVHITSTIGLLGDVDGEFHYDGLEQPLNDQSHLTIGPLRGHYKLNQAQGLFNYFSKGNRVTFTEQGIDVELQEPALNCDIALNDITVVPIGECQLQFKQFSLQERSSNRVVADSDATSSSLRFARSGSWINSQLSLASDQVVIDQGAVSDVKVNSRVDGLSETAMQLFKEKLAVSGAPQTLEAWRPLLAGLFNQGEPKLAVTASAARDSQRLDFTADIEISAGLLGDGTLFSLLTAIQAWVELDVHQTLLHDLLAALVDRSSQPTVQGLEPVGADAKAIIARWVEQGILVADGDRWRLDLAYHLGVISLNGETINPVEFSRR